MSETDVNLSLNSSVLSKKRDMFMFYFQIMAIFIVLVVSLGNIIFKNGDQVLWTTLLGWTLGYVLPPPKLRKVEANDSID